jgi:diaminopimelate decarboxylase
VGDASVLITRVTYVKETAHTHFAIVDAGMNDLIRPAMYGARHGIAPVAEKADAPRALFTIVGPVCESSDVFGAAYDLPPLKEGDLIAILQAGAYGSAMASTYNGRPLIPDALVAGKAHALTRRRLSVAEQIALESYPAWMAGKQEG